MEYQELLKQQIEEKKRQKEKVLSPCVAVASVLCVVYMRFVSKYDQTDVSTVTKHHLITALH